eukprot:TRINITY_DN3710_c0_g1_i3.p1 TRINITY_DN3710_c0_g1~~TRINITY_DN3710_c0_g1_i3.p1  ORF type:complete len:422 (-),score=73.81 TRINITY_DN3710_c0_g1_i3:742-1923(-)
MAKRMDLASTCRKTKMCKFFLTNACQRGSTCAYAHSEAEIRAPPNLRCTQLCPSAAAGTVCSNADCRFAHDAKELKRFPGANLQQTEAGSRPEAGHLRLSQASLAAMAAQQALAAATSVVNEAPILVGRTSGALANIEALKRAQAVISQAVASLEDELKSSSSQTITGSHLKSRSGKFVRPASSDEETTDCDSRDDDLRSCQRESERMSDGFSRQASWADMFENSERKLDSATTDLGIAFGRQVSDFGPVFGRQVSYKHEFETKFRPAAGVSSVPVDVAFTCDSTRLCVKNTFYTLIEEEPHCSSSRRSSSVPGRFVSGSSDGDDAKSGGRLDAKDSQPVTKRRMLAMTTKSVAPQKQHTWVFGPLPAGLVQARPVLLGRMTAGISRKGFQWS